MAVPSRHEGDHDFAGAVRVIGTLTMPASTVGNTQFNASDPLATAKQKHRYSLDYFQADGSAVVVAIMPIHIVRGATATVLAIQVQCVDSPSGGDLKFTVDLLKADDGTPTPATMLSAVVDYVNGTADCVVLAGTLASSALVVGDMLIVQVAVSGSTGTQGQGLIVTVTLDEDAA